MGLFTLPPKLPRADLELESFLKSDATETSVRRFRRMLAPEWFPQSGVQLTWPHAGTDWAYMLDEITALYVRLAYEIATRETLLIVTPDAGAVSRLLCEKLPQRATQNIIYAECPTNDTWARDHAFLTVVGTGAPELLDFRFNGWGGKFEAALDNAINRRIHSLGAVRGTYTDRLDFELEGGSIEVDGLGNLLTTSACLLNPNRNAALSKQDIEARLRDWFSVENILWLDHGNLAGDDTDSHIDTLARLCPDNRIVYTRCTNTADPHHAGLAAMEEQLASLRNMEGKPFDLVPLPLPDPIECDGERLPATYANYLVLNEAVLYPTYAQPANDEAARRALHGVFPKRELVGIDCRPLIRQHGSLHCATMQYPRHVLPSPEEYRGAEK